jgi:hypothetical protein
MLQLNLPEHIEAELESAASLTGRTKEELTPELLAILHTARDIPSILANRLQERATCCSKAPQFPKRNHRPKIACVYRPNLKIFYPKNIGKFALSRGLRSRASSISLKRKEIETKTQVAC